MLKTTWIKMKNQFAAISVLIGCCMSLRVIEDGSIPSVAETGQELQLTCKYELEGDSLYSLKWYKDNAEFYRYTPSDIPHVTVFLSPGLDVSDTSQPTNIILRNVSSLTNGQFKCEVSGDAPRFQTDVRIGNLKIVKLPATGPEIHGVRPKYRVGDTLQAVCQSAKSNPVAQLKWYINNDAADINQVKVIHSTPKSHAQASNRDRTTSRKSSETNDITQLQLRFKVHEKHFVLDKNGVRQDLRLKCTAQVLDLYWKSSEVAVQHGGIAPLPSYFWPHTGEASRRQIKWLLMCSLLMATLVLNQ